MKKQLGKTVGMVSTAMGIGILCATFLPAKAIIVLAAIAVIATGLLMLQD